MDDKWLSPYLCKERAIEKFRNCSVFRMIRNQDKKNKNPINLCMGEMLRQTKFRPTLCLPVSGPQNSNCFTV